jgi:hypothetical protein
MSRPRYHLTSEQLKILPNKGAHYPKAYRYAKLMAQGIEFPPVNIYFNKSKNMWDYNDGRHRVLAAKLSETPLYVTSAKKMGKKLY